MTTDVAVVDANVQDSQITLDQLKRCIPKGVNVTLTQDMVDKVNNIIASDEYAEEYRNNLTTYTSVLLNPKFRIADYINAVRFVTCKLLGDKNELAYAKTFPDRYDRLIKAGKSAKDISAHTSGYAANAIVVAITEQSMMPLHIVNNDLRQQAINVLANTMLDDKVSAKVKVEAADKLLAHLTPPKDTKIEINLGQKQTSVISELAAATSALAQQQRMMLESGLHSIKDVAESKLVLDGEYEEQ